MQRCRQGFLGWKKLFWGVVFFMALLTVSNAHAGIMREITNGKGRLYLAITSPVEWMTRNHMTELQHITPQKYNGNFNDTILITWSNHTISDRWKDKPYLARHDNAIISLMTLGNASSLESLNAAYRMGAYVYPYSIFRYGYYKNDVGLVCTELDAPSMLLYGVS